MGWQRYLVGSRQGKRKRVFLLPRIGGCYAFFGDGRLLYVGSCRDLRERMSQWEDHAIGRAGAIWSTMWGDFSCIEIRVRPARFYAEWATLELRLLRRLSPPGNFHGVRAEKRRALRVWKAGA